MHRRDHLNCMKVIVIGSADGASLLSAFKPNCARVAALDVKNGSIREEWSFVLLRQRSKVASITRAPCLCRVRRGHFI
jgi:hypothetical protein